MLILASALNSSPARCAAAPWPDEAKFSAPGLCLGERDQLGHGVGRHARIDHQDVRLGADQADRREILLGVVAELLVERRVGGEDAVVAHQQRVAIGIGVLDLLGREVAAGAGPVLDDEGLMQDFLEPPGDERATERRSARRA